MGLLFLVADSQPLSPSHQQLANMRPRRAQVMPLCTKERILKNYATLNKASLAKKDGSHLHLYSSLLALLLRLSSIRGGDAREIARRTKEVPNSLALRHYASMSEIVLAPPQLIKRV